MKIVAKLNQLEMKEMISEWLRNNHGNNFPAGADVSFNIVKGDRPGDMDIITATATAKAEPHPRD